MKPLWRRGLHAAGALAILTGFLATATPAAAVPVTNGTFTMHSPPDDYIGQGQDYSYVAGPDVISASTNDTGSVISVSIDGANGDWWFADFAAPGNQPLAVGAYPNAMRYPFQDPGHPGLDVFGNGRGCNTLTGQFTINAIVLGPHGYLQTFDADFEQSCEGFGAPLTGHVSIDNPPPPAELELAIAVSVNGTFSRLNGNATVMGTVTCTQPVSVQVFGDITQVAHRVIIRGTFGTTVACTPGAPLEWQATAVPQGTTPFQRGDVQVRTQASATDPFYGTTITAGNTTVVKLRRG